jgi:hypothetical protein
MVEFTFEYDAWKRLILILKSGERYVGAEPIRAFPLSDPSRAISICDSEGREIVYLDSIEQAPADLQPIIERELAQREFVPRILRIMNHPTDAEPAQWRVETDRGVTAFHVDSTDAVRRQVPHQISIVDSLGIRYLIPDTTKLDEDSRRVLDRFL